MKTCVFGNIGSRAGRLGCFFLQGWHGLQSSSPFAKVLCPALAVAFTAKECDMSTDSSMPKGVRTHLLLLLLENRQSEISK